MTLPSRGDVVGSQNMNQSFLGGWGRIGRVTMQKYHEYMHDGGLENDELWQEVQSISGTVPKSFVREGNLKVRVLDTALQMVGNQHGV